LAVHPENLPESIVCFELRHGAFIEHACSAAHRPASPVAFQFDLVAEKFTFSTASAAASLCGMLFRAAAYRYPLKFMEIRWKTI
jgi:hypothetical protein